jgi:ABC-2 type transport system permease protein
MDLQKFWIIFKWEYLTKIRKKAFIIVTLLIPVGFALLFTIPIILQQMNPSHAHKIALKDATGLVSSKMIRLNPARYIDASSTSVPGLRKEVKKGKINGYIVVTNDQIQHGNAFKLVSDGSGGMAFVNSVRSELQTAVRQARLTQAGASDQILSIIHSKPTLIASKLTAEGGETSSHTISLFAMGYAMAFIIYIAIFGYGGYVMRSVIDEKTSRIYEIVVSSAKPSELLLGKIAGIGALGVTQFIIWIGAAVLAVVLAGSAFTHYIGPQTAALLHHLPSIIGIKMGIYFIVFFILGFLLYGSILAAVSSAVDSSSDTQQMMMPVLIPVIIAIILLGQVANRPDSSLAVISSLIPFFSPILMIGRIPITTVPAWQIGLSIILLLISVAICLYIGSKIYRVGILSYGKSAGFKELWKWIKR